MPSRRKTLKKWGPASMPTQKMNSIKPTFSVEVENWNPIWPNSRAVNSTPMVLPI
ncbi:hypothetical protein D3C84_1183810 [compost metagenome]